MQAEGIMAQVARQQWLNPVEEKLQGLIHHLFARGGDSGKKIKNFLHGTWAGHPLHVILTDVPLGAWTAGIVFDGLEVITGREEFATAADGCIAIGLAGALGAAVTGITDWQDVDPPARRIGLVHAALNVAGVTMFAGSLITRRKSRSRGRGLAALGYVIATAAARFGGNLVYEQRIGVDRTASQEFPRDFVPVLQESDLPEGRPVRAEHNGIPILLVRQGERILATAETCSHLGGPLSEGKLEGDTIQCPWHGSRFLLEDGRVIDGPAVHPLPCLEARVRNRQIEVRQAGPHRRPSRLPRIVPKRTPEPSVKTGTYRP